MTEDIIAGIRTAIDHDAKALGPAIDRMTEWADTLDGRERATVLRQAELLRWMMHNVDRVDEAGVMRMRCEFPRDPLAHKLEGDMWFKFDIDCYAGIENVLSELRLPNFFFKSQAIVVPTTLAAWVGEMCVFCDGRGWWTHQSLLAGSPSLCPRCDGPGRVNAIGPRAVLAAPILELTLEDVEPALHFSGYVFTQGRLPPLLPSEIEERFYNPKRFPEFNTPEAARAAVSTAALNWARRQAGMQHDIEGRRFER